MPEIDLSGALENLYDDYRNALLNRKYYGKRLTNIKRSSTVMDILIAVGASSAVGGWTIWSAEAGRMFWSAFGGAVALLAIIKPFMKFSEEIERLTANMSGHSDVFYDLDLLVKEAKRTHKYTAEMQASHVKAMARIRELEAKDDPVPNERIREWAFAEVNRELPVDIFWMPAPRPARRPAPSKGREKTKPGKKIARGGKK